jgi:hypothetical protein
MVTNSNLLFIISHNIEFNVLIIPQFAKYGLNNCLTHEQEEPLIEFYDNRHKHTEFGQFISRYNTSTLTSRDIAGLNLQGGVADWYIDAKEMHIVTEWLLQHPLTKDFKDSELNFSIKKNHNKF